MIPSPISAARLPLSPDRSPGNAGIRCRYPIDSAAWIWAPPPETEQEIQLVTFELEFTLEEDRTLCFDVSADQRYLLRADGQEFGRGPDRAEAGGWSFHRYELSLTKGTHRLDADCWWLRPGLAPLAQISVRPGFAIAGVNEASGFLNTGSAPWKVQTHHGISALPKNRNLSYHVIGCGFRLEAARGIGPWRDPVLVHQGWDDQNGIMHAPWRCEPSPLPEQDRTLFQGGRIRGNEARVRYQGICSGEPVRIPAHSTVELFWDFEDYVCGYPRAHLRGGRGAVLSMEWAESLYESPEPDAGSPKGHRAAIDGKYWLGFGDELQAAGEEQTDEILWWRSGRWLRIRVQTQEEPLEILDLRPRRTGHPFHPRWQVQSEGLSADMLRLCESGLRNCVHETFVDCPYYEQLQYLGDTRVQALAWLVTTGDPRPVARALELFDRSRWINGFFAERCPSAPPQLSATYSLLYPLLLRDFSLWCDDPDRVRRHLPGVRSSLEMALACIGKSGLPEHLPGWLFIDWVHDPFWKHGVPGGETGKLTAPIALHLPLALLAAAELEEASGDPLLAQRWRAQARSVYAKIDAAFWCTDRNRFADDTDKRHWSEHTQALALLLPFADTEKRSAMLDALLLPSPDMARASVYFSFYVHEALLLHGHSEALLTRFQFWNQLHDQGFLTTVEAPEPSRSDCHGWGSHPLYHTLTGLAGIHPAAPGFTRVAIRPGPGPLNDLEAAVPHPRGEILVHFRRENGAVQFTVHTPVPGTLHWQGQAHPLQADAENRISFPQVFPACLHVVTVS